MAACERGCHFLQIFRVLSVFLSSVFRKKKMSVLYPMLNFGHFCPPPPPPPVLGSMGTWMNQVGVMLGDGGQE